MNDFRMGRHEEAIRTLQADMNEVKRDTRAILALLDERKGERRTMVKLGAVLGAATGSLVTMLGKLVLVRLGLHG
jgi:hypothetical protein